MNNKLLILGAGQYGTVAMEIAQAMKCFDAIDFLDDHNEMAIGKFLDYEGFVNEYSYAFVALGDSRTRLQWIQKLEEACFRIAVLVHPRAYISPSAQIMKGTAIEPMAVVQSNTSIAVGCILSAGAVVNHDCFIGDGCHIDCNATIKAGIVLRSHTKIDCGSVIRVSLLDGVNKNIPEEYYFEAGF
jgi:UDP-3-O-[3-hydroxymyristoyl] glucosamine N-acyltransferase